VGVEILALILHPNAFPYSSEPETAVRLDPAKFGASGEIADHRR
jgi:hypothetical protein